MNDEGMLPVLISALRNFRAESCCPRHDEAGRTENASTLKDFQDESESRMDSNQEHAMMRGKAHFCDFSPSTRQLAARQTGVVFHILSAFSGSFSGNGP